MAGKITPVSFLADAVVVDTAGVVAALSSGKVYGTDEKLLIATSAPIVAWANGLPLAADGRIVCVTKSSASAPFSFSNGLSFDATGALVVTDAASATAPLSTVNEVTLDATGALLVDGVNFSLSFLSSFPSNVTFSRGSNAMMFDSQGQLVWAPANLNAYTESYGGTGWSANGTPSVTASADAPSGFSASVELTTTGANHGYFGASGLNRNLTVGASYVFSCWAKSISGNNNIAFQAGGTVVPVPVTSEWTRVSAIVIAASTIPAVYINGVGTMRIAGIQVEPAGPDSPKAYNATAGSAYYGPRIDYDPVTLAIRGFLIEIARTNSLRNGAGVGAVVGAPGILPTNWNYAVTVPTTEIVAMGTENGVPYVDVRLQGLTTGAASEVRLDVANVIAAVTGQSWAQSGAVRMSAGSLANISDVRYQITARDAGGAALNVYSTVLTKLSASSLTLAFEENVKVIPDATLAFVQPGILVNHTNGAVIDITLRIGLQQMEQATFVTSPIPTYGATATRNRDVATLPVGSWWNAAGPNSWFSEYIPGPLARAAASPAVWSIAASGSDRFMLVCSAAQVAQIINTTGGVSTFSPLAIAPQVSFTLQKSAGTLANNDVLLVDKTDGAALRQITTYSPSNSLFTTLRLGSNDGGSQVMNGWLRSLAFYPVRLTNPQLQDLVA